MYYIYCVVCIIYTCILSIPAHDGYVAVGNTSILLPLLFQGMTAALFQLVVVGAPWALEPWGPCWAMLALETLSWMQHLTPWDRSGERGQWQPVQGQERS